MATDQVTGSRTWIELTVDLPPAQLWDLVTDIGRQGEWSPECEYAAWLDTADPGPRVGARFQGRNRFADGRVNEVVCEVVAAQRPYSFAWVVGEDPARPSTTWRYDLRQGSTPGRTLVRHSFEHGPGDSRLRTAVERYPDRAEHIVASRMQQLREHMRETLTAMTRG